MLKTPVVNDISVASLRSEHEIFDMIVSKHGVPESWSREEGFETLSRIILEQQVSLQSAKAAYEKLLARIGSFTPENILALTSEDMRKATISRQKASYIQGLATDILNGSFDLQVLGNISTDEAIHKLVSIRGIGPWTAQVYVLFCLQAPDVFPKGDVALNNTGKELLSVTTAEEVYSEAASWSPYRSCAAFLLWHYYLCERGRQFVI